MDLPDAPMTRVILCGDREWSDWAAIVRALRTLDPANTMVITGAARGADALAETAAAAMGFEARVVMPANWAEFGRAAGPLRNQQMLQVVLAGAPEHDRLVMAFHDSLDESRGTRDMVRRARRAGVRVKLYRHGGKSG